MRGESGRIVALVAALALSACAPPAATVTSAVTDDDCQPSTPDSVAPPGDPERRIEDIIEYLTGERQTDDVPVEEKIDDPNFGGVWGDRAGGIIVAVLDCSDVDAERLAEIAGGSANLRLIKVPYTFHQVEDFRDVIVEDLAAAGVAGDVLIDSTVEGRKIEVVVEELDSLPESFGSDIPDEIFEVVEGEISREG